MAGDGQAAARNVRAFSIMLWSLTSQGYPSAVGSSSIDNRLHPPHTNHITHSAFFTNDYLGLSVLDR
jgi:hypothetical protein